MSQTNDLHPFTQLSANLRTIASKYHLRLELLPYPDPQSLEQALMEKEVHATCIERSQLDIQDAPQKSEPQLYHTAIRIRRLYNILQTELTSPASHLTYIPVPDSGEKH